MNETVPIYDLTINEDDEGKFTGVNYVALVDDPAIEMGWKAFKKQEPTKFNFNDERRIITGPLMIADKPILRYDDNKKEYWVKFSKKEIEKISMKFMRNGLTRNVNEMHDSSKIANGVYLFELWNIDFSRGITAPEGYGNISDGSLMGSMYVENPAIWSKVKNREYTGFSVEGWFLENLLGNVEKSLIDELNDIFSS